MVAKQQSCLVAILAAVALLAGSEHSVADITTGSWFLDQSNEFDDSVKYGQVDIVANSGLGTVQFTVDAFDDVPVYGGVGDNFGIQLFGFNYANVSSDPTTWGVDGPDGWAHTTTAQLDGFGAFQVYEVGDGDSRQDPLEFTITLPTVAEAVVENFVVFSTGTAGQGNALFVARVAGFGGDGDGSHWIAAVPTPSAVILTAIGLGALGLMKRWRPALDG